MTLDTVWHCTVTKSKCVVLFSLIPPSWHLSCIFSFLIGSRSGQICWSFEADHPFTNPYAATFKSYTCNDTSKHVWFIRIASTSISMFFLSQPRGSSKGLWVKKQCKTIAKNIISWIIWRWFIKTSLYLNVYSHKH